MKIIESKFIYVKDKYIQDSAIVFDKTIIEVGLAKDIKKRYPNAQLIRYEGNSILYPGFVNAHTHLEFSANKSALRVGGFIEWLYSVFEFRDDLVEKLDSNIMQKSLEQMLKSGVTTFGEISSFGADLEACVSAPQRVVYFNEAIGSNPAMVDALFADFKMRLEASKEYASDKFYPAIAIHSPYSVHPFLIREVLKIANNQNLLVSAHFLESKSEREWLESNSGEFLELFNKFFNTKTAVNTIEGFLSAFKDTKTLFTHVTQAKEAEFNKINSSSSSVIHCPRSNRLLDCGKLDISSVDNLLLGTDGLSSNYSLSILDELKSALIMHTDIPPKELAIKLIDAVTSNAANALGLNLGEIKKDYFADFAIFELPEDLNDFSKGSLALNTIIECESAKSVFVAGKRLI